MRQTDQEYQTNQQEDAATGITVSICDNFDDVAAFAQQWDQLVESTGGEIFMTYDWCRIWWKHYQYGRKLKIFTFYRKDELAGIIPLFFDKIWLGPIYIRTAALVGSDFTPVTVSLPVRDGCLTEVIQKFLDILTKRFQWDVLHLGPVAGTYDKFGELQAACDQFADDTYTIQSTSNGVQTYFILSDSLEDQIARLSKQERKRMRRNYKVINSKDVPLKAEYTSADNYETYFDEFVELHQLRWQKVGKAGHFKDWPGAYEFHRELAAAQFGQKRLRLLKVSLGDLCLGYKYAYKIGEQYHSLLDARVCGDIGDSLDIGRLLYCEQVKKAIEDNVRIIDSMRGEFEHKLHLGGELYPVKNIRIYLRKFSVSMRLSIFGFLAHILNICYYKIWFCRIAPRLRYKRGHLWRIWIKSRTFC